MVIWPSFRGITVLAGGTFLPHHPTSMGFEFGVLARPNIGVNPTHVDGFAGCFGFFGCFGCFNCFVGPENF